MKSPLSKYAFINAKLRTRISMILTDEFMDRPARAHTLLEAIEQFRGTDYQQIETVYDRTGDLKMVEYELFKREIAIHVEMEKYTEGEVLDFISALTTRYEIETLKQILRLWFDKVVRNRDITEAYIYLYREKIHNNLKANAILETEEPEKITSLLSDTPYGAVVKKPLEDVSFKKSIFAVEMALDGYFHEQLFRRTEHLSDTDRETARRLLGVEIDLLNINLLVRFRNFYKLSMEETLSSLLPHGRSISRESLSSLTLESDPAGVLGEVLKRRYPGMSGMLSAQGTDSYSRLIFMERMLDKILEQEVHKVLAGYPFTIGIILVYFVLKRAEIRRISTLLNAKYYGIEFDRIKSSL